MLNHTIFIEYKERYMNSSFSKDWMRKTYQRFKYCRKNCLRRKCPNSTRPWTPSYCLLEAKAGDCHSWKACYIRIRPILGLKTLDSSNGDGTTCHRNELERSERLYVL